MNIRVFTKANFVGALFAGALCLTSNSSACEMTRSEKSEIYVVPEISLLHYGSKVRSTGPISSEIYNCQKNAGKSLMFSIGAKRPSIFSDVEFISFDGRYKQALCEAKNSSLDTVSAQNETAIHLAKQHNFIRSCMTLKLRDLDHEVIEFTPNQIACKARAQTSGTVSLDGDYCFIKVNPTTHLQVNVEIKQDCLKPAYLNFHHITAGDINTLVNVWVAGDQSGVSTDLEYIRSLPVKVSVMPSAKVLSLSENFFKPEILFPNTYHVDINPGPLSLQKVGPHRYNLDFGLEVKNISPEKCLPGQVCASVSDFQMPLAGTVELSEIATEIAKSGEEFLKSWPYLAVVPPQYQGLMKNSFRPTLENINLEPHHVYQLKFTMIDPFEDYKMAVKKIQAIKFNLPVPNETLDGMQNTPSLESLGEMKPISSLPSGMITGSVEGSLEELDHILKARTEPPLWPQRYSTICPAGDDDRACVGIERLSEIVTITVQFQVGLVEPSTNLLQLKQVKLAKTSSILSKLKQQTNQLPTLSCNR